MRYIFNGIDKGLYQVAKQQELLYAFNGIGKGLYQAVRQESLLKIIKCRCCNFFLEISTFFRDFSKMEKWKKVEKRTCNYKINMVE